MPSCNFVDGRHIAKTAVQMHRQYCSGTRRNSRFDCGRIHVMILAYVDQNRYRPRMVDRRRRRYERMRDGNDFIAGAYSQSAERKMQGVRTVAESDRKLCPHEPSQGFLKVTKLSAEHQIAI